MTKTAINMSLKLVSAFSSWLWSWLWCHIFLRWRPISYA